MRGSLAREIGLENRFSKSFSAGIGRRGAVLRRRNRKAAAGRADDPPARTTDGRLCPDGAPA
jgi:hypothetical protein